MRRLIFAPHLPQKSDPEKPKWYMVDLTFKSRAKHFVPLALLKYIASLPLPTSSDDEEGVPGLVEELSYLGRKDVAAIKGTYHLGAATWVEAELFSRNGPCIARSSERPARVTNGVGCDQPSR